MPGPAQSARIDDAALTHHLVAPAVGMAVKDVGKTAVCRQVRHISAMAVGDGNGNALDFPGKRRGEYIPRIQLFERVFKPAGIAIHVACYRNHLKLFEQNGRVRAGHIAAVDECGDTTIAKQRECVLQILSVVVRVRKYPKFHAPIVVQPSSAWTGVRVTGGCVTPGWQIGDM